jgi:hypothetical protein
VSTIDRAGHPLAEKHLKELKNFQQLVIMKQQEILNEWEKNEGDI